MTRLADVRIAVMRRRTGLADRDLAAAGRHDALRGQRATDPCLLAVRIDLQAVTSEVDLATRGPAVQHAFQDSGDKIALEKALASERRVLRHVNELVADQRDSLDALRPILIGCERDYVTDRDRGDSFGRGGEERAHTLGIDDEAGTIEDAGREGDPTAALAGKERPQPRPQRLGKRYRGSPEIAVEVLEQRDRRRREGVLEQPHVAVGPAVTRATIDRLHRRWPAARGPGADGVRQNERRHDPQHWPALTVPARIAPRHGCHNDVGPPSEATGGAVMVGPTVMGCGRTLGGLLVLIASVGTVAPMAGDAAESEAKPRSVTVVGYGRERGAPDTAELRFAVEQTAPTAQAAAQAAAKNAEHVLEALRKEVGPGGKVETAGFSLNPNYRPEPPPQAGVRQRGPEIVSYTASNEVTAQTRRIDAVGALIDAGIAAGAARVNQLTFSIEDPGPLQTRALRAAGADAAAQAAAIVETLHVQLKEVLEATTESVARPLPQRYAGTAMRAEAAMVQTPIEAGAVTAEARLRVTYRIE